MHSVHFMTKKMIAQVGINPSIAEENYNVINEA